MVKFTKKNCNPQVKGKTIKNHSCLTKNIIYEIKKEYNKKAINKITTNDPKLIWDELRHRMKQCNDEQCWIDNLYQQGMRKRIHEYIFSPEKPHEWSKNPYEWLSNYDIEGVMKQYERAYSEFKFIGTTFIDWLERNGDSCVSKKLCNFDLSSHIKSGITKIGIVFNLDKHTGPGTHWVTLFIDVKDRFIFYFDSNGTKIPKNIKIFVEKVKEQSKLINTPFKLFENSPFVHQYSNTECGMYSLFCMITFITNEVNGKNITNKSDKINLFKRKRVPDNHMKLLRNIYFN